MKSYRVIGLMSGTSLDGLDIAFCEFSREGNRWQYQVVEAETIEYEAEWKERLAKLDHGSALEFATADTAYGHLLGRLTRAFMERTGLVPDFIASHGHTIFHQPALGLTSQIGKGPAIAAETGLPVISDFRSLDVALGGQGAPLVPIGDRLLFGDYTFCLNLGGFANISTERDGRRVAWDICPVNIVMNRLASAAGYAYDPGGEIAASGIVDDQLLSSLNELPYYRMSAPKSLGKEWTDEQVRPLLDRSGLRVADLLATWSEHAARQIAAAAAAAPGNTMLVTGGGAFNTHLIERIGHHTASRLILPDPLIIGFKEALIFALLGLLRHLGENNCLSSVTGASRDSCGGVIS